MLPRPDFPKRTSPLGQAVRVLLLEDDPISVEIVGTYLRRLALADLNLHAEATLSGAIALLARTEVDLVISDLHLPDSGGAATIEALAHAVSCPVIAITSHADPAMREATLTCGAYEFLHKSELTEATLARLVRLAVMQAQTFRSLRESETRFRSLSALSSDWFWETDRDHRFVMTPSRVESVTGLGPQAYVGKTRWEVPGLAPLVGEWAAHKQALARRESFRDLHLVQVRTDGSRCYLQISGEPMYDADGAFKGYRGTAKDVTLRTQEENLLRLEHAVTQRLAVADSAAQAAREVIRAVCEAEGWGCGRYFALDEAAGVMRFEEAWARPGGRFDGFVASSRGQTYARGVGLVGSVWASGRPVWVKDASSDRRVAFSGLAREHGVHSALVFPVTAGDRVVGAVSISSDAIREPDARLLGTMRVVGSQLGLFLQRCGAEAALRESEARFRTLTALTSDWYWEQDAELRFVTTGGASDARGGITPEAHVGLRRWELPRTEIISQSWDEHRAVLYARQPFTELLLRRTSEDGEVRYVSVAGQPVFDARGTFSGYRGVAKDVTNKIASELALRRFRAALDAAGDMVFLVDGRDSTYLDFNETACRILGYTREEMLGMETVRVRLDRTREQLIEDYRGLAAAPGTSMTTVGTYRRKDGSTFPVEVTRRLLETSDGEVVVATARDLTERMRAEQRQAMHHRYQERIARFGQAALAKRDPAELSTEAAQTLLEALHADAVAYVEPGLAQPELVLRTLVGVADTDGDNRMLACPDSEPVLQVMRTGRAALAQGASLSFPWAQRLRSAALVPVRGERGVRGALCVFFEEAGGFREDSLKFIEAAATLLSTGLQRIDSEGRLAYLAQFDQLTGLPNRTLLTDRFSQMIGQAGRRGSALAMLFVDLDEFKMVNDTLGHAGGDALLKEVAARLQSTVRSGDTVARISGDEFAIVLADIARPEDAALVAQKIIDRFSSAVQVHGKEVFVTASVGIAAFPGDGADAETLIRAADAAMYRAKQAGRNGYQFFTAEINQRSRARAHMGTELRRALEREEFALVYQPKLHLSSRRLGGAEALLRWRHPERGVVSPAEFIPVLEETGLIVPVGEWVIAQVCKDLKVWQAAGMNIAPVSVNLSARQFRLQDLDARIKSLVASAGVDPGLFELEITESQLMQDPDQAIRVMRALCDAGMRIAIDDFGTGYSSLAYLRRFPIVSLKIDRSFIKDMASDGGDAAIVRAIIEMAHSVGFTVTAEGVETEEQAALLRLLRCDQAQGFLFARPMPAQELAGFYAP